MSTLFNGPVEVGIRVLMLLIAAHPRRLDLDSLVVLDYLLVHSGDVREGPPSIHPASPLRSGEVAIRRQLIENAILLLRSRALISQEYSDDGIEYSVGEYGVVFVDALHAEYTRNVRSRAVWAAGYVAGRDPITLVRELTGSLDKWGHEFALVAAAEREDGLSR